MSKKIFVAGPYNCPDHAKITIDKNGTIDVSEYDHD